MNRLPSFRRTKIGPLKPYQLLIKNKHDRMEALSIARRLCQVDGTCDDTEKNMMDKIKNGLKL